MNKQACWIAVDVAHSQGSIALKIGNDAPVLHHLNGTASDILMSEVLQLLARNGKTIQDVTHLACNQGPGGFTGLRLGASVLQGLSFGLRSPLWGACSLEASAEAYIQHLSLQECIQQRISIWVVQDARLGQVFWARFEWVEGKWICHQPPELSDPEGMWAPEVVGQKWVAVGIGWALYPGLQEKFAAYIEKIDDKILSNAASILQVASRWADNGIAGQIGRIELNYLRNKVAQTVVERKEAKEKINAVDSF
jgi:tRNA threonylcarbamoyladenosine biosynthesis protein TsaB